MNPLFPLLFQTNRHLSYELNEALKPFDLHHAQWAIVYLLHCNGPLPLTSIWKALLVEAPTVTRTVTRLEQLGFVRREQGADKREKIVYLTNMAQVKIPEILRAIETFEMQMSSNLSEEEQRQLMQLLKKIKE